MVGVLPAFIGQGYVAKTYHVGDGFQTRSFCFVDDLVKHLPCYKRLSFAGILAIQRNYHPSVWRGNSKLTAPGKINFASAS